jgi:hypothetical protein
VDNNQGRKKWIQNIVSEKKYYKEIQGERENAGE